MARAGLQTGLGVPLRTTLRRGRRLLMHSVLGAMLTFTEAGQAVAAPEASTAAALFDGALPLRGRMRGDDAALPLFASRCVNCHGSQGASNATYAPALDRRWLTQLRSRRGGPASAFDADSFCRLLRTGVDPKDVMVSRAMPVYEVGSEQCAALWTFLTQAQESP